MPVWCHAIVRDDDGRVLQLKDPDVWEWSIPGRPMAEGGDALAAAIDALTSQVGLAPDGFGEEPLEIESGHGGTRRYFVFGRIDRLGPLAPDVARASRWAPTDFLSNRTLAGALNALPDG